MNSQFGDIQKLADLLKLPEEDSDTDDDLPQSGMRKMGKSNFDATL